MKTALDVVLFSTVVFNSTSTTSSAECATVAAFASSDSSRDGPVSHGSGSGFACSATTARGKRRQAKARTTRGRNSEPRPPRRKTFQLACSTRHRGSRLNRNKSNAIPCSAVCVLLRSEDNSNSRYGHPNYNIIYSLRYIYAYPYNLPIGHHTQISTLT